MTIFISYIFLGLSLAAPIGPVNAAQMEKGIKHGFLNAWILGIGSVLADIVYMMTVFLGVGHFIQIPIVKAFLWSFGFFVLIYTGIEGLANAGRFIFLSKEKVNHYGNLFYRLSNVYLQPVNNPFLVRNLRFCFGKNSSLICL